MKILAAQLNLWRSTALLIGAALLLSMANNGFANSVNGKQNNIFPPWQNGENNDAPKRGLNFTVPPVDVLADFHGNPVNPKLSIYAGGNYFFAMAPLVKQFEQEHPEYQGRVYWETLPPGKLVEQIKQGGTVTSGNMTWTVQGDVYFTGQDKIKELINEGLLVGPAVPYVTNQLTIMIPKDNPARITGLQDLGKPNVRLIMPNPEFEDVAKQIKESLQKAGGKPLADAVYTEKVQAGTSVLSQIHHRETPLYLMQGKYDAGVVWKSEAIFQEQIGNPIAQIEIPPEQNVTGVYAGALVKGAPHPEAGQLWLQFIRSPSALKIFERYGFKPYKEGSGK